MQHKIFKRARREWNAMMRDGNENDASMVAQWAMDYARLLINEVTRLREELKQRNRKKRAIHAKLAHESDDHDELLADVRKLRAWIDGYDVLAKYVLHERIDVMLEPYKDDDD